MKLSRELELIAERRSKQILDALEKAASPAWRLAIITAQVKAAIYDALREKA